MPGATVTNTEYGYEVTGGTTATTINSGTLRVRAFGFVGNDATDTIALTTLVNGAAVSCYKFKAVTDDDASMSYVYFGKEGIPMTGLAVTLNDTSNFLYVFIR